MKNPCVHSSSWAYLHNTAILRLFKENLGDVTLYPQQELVDILKSFSTATLEVVENRTFSTVYRVRQTGEVYQVCQDGDDITMFSYDDYGDYLDDTPVDELMQKYDSKMPNHSVYRGDDGYIYVVRNNPPKFTAQYNEGTEELKFIEVKDSVTSDQLAKHVRKVGDTISRFLKNERK